MKNKLFNIFFNSTELWLISTIEEFANGRFQEVIDDTINPNNVTKLVFCTGKFYYDLLAERTTLERNDVALVRIEQLFPLHLDKLKEIIASYPAIKSYVWVVIALDQNHAIFYGDSGVSETGESLNSY